MAFKNWLKAWELLDRSPRSTSRRRPGKGARFRPRVEVLEDRTTAEKDWAYARSWLRVAIDRMSGHPA